MQFHNSNVFCSYIIHVSYTGCDKIKKIIPAPKCYYSFCSLWIPAWAVPLENFVVGMRKHVTEWVSDCQRECFWRSEWISKDNKIYAHDSFGRITAAGRMCLCYVEHQVIRLQWKRLCMFCNFVLTYLPCCLQHPTPLPKGIQLSLKRVFQQQ